MLTSCALTERDALMAEFKECHRLWQEGEVDKAKKVFSQEKFNRLVAIEVASD